MMNRMFRVSVTSAMLLGTMVLCLGCGSKTESTVYYPFAPSPVFNPLGGASSAPQKITISDAVAGATIYYTTDGSGPTTSSAQYTGAITVAVSETIRAVADATGYQQSFPSSASYVVVGTTPAAAMPVFSVTPDSDSSTASVALSDETPGAAIYYTTNGLPPTTESTLYTGPIRVSSSQIIQAIAVADGFKSSAMARAAYPGTAGSPSSEAAGDTQ
jgi:hypothetical protein